jgi:hypothetical protein
MNTPFYRVIESARLKLEQRTGQWNSGYECFHGSSNCLIKDVVLDMYCPWVKAFSYSNILTRRPLEDSKKGLHLYAAVLDAVFAEAYREITGRGRAPRIRNQRFMRAYLEAYSFSFGKRRCLRLLSRARPRKSLPKEKQIEFFVASHGVEYDPKRSYSQTSK